MCQNTSDTENVYPDPDRIRKLVSPIERFWGRSLPVEIIGEKRGQRYCWDNIQIPRSMTEESDQQITCFLLHETGHRTIAPVSLARVFWWEILAKMEDVPNPEEMVHLFCDLLVDTWYLNHFRWGGTYSIQLKKSSLQALRGNKTMITPLQLFRIKCYIEAGRWHREFSQFAFDLDHVETVIRMIRDESKSFDTRIRLFFRQMLKMSGKVQFMRLSSRSETSRKSEEGPSTEIIGRKPDWRSFQWDSSELLRMIRSNGIRLSEAGLESVLGESVAKQLATRLTVLDSLVRVTPKVEKLVESKRSQTCDGFKGWKPGDLPSELNSVQSLEQAGVLIPGVTTLKNRYIRNRPKESEQPDICLVVDNSCSTSGSIIQHELDAAIAVVESAKRFESKVGLIVFGSNVDVIHKPGHEYNKIESLLAGLTGESGGTRLAPALGTASRFKPKDGEKLATIVFTDSFIFDIDPSVRQLSELKRYGPVVLFCVENELDSEFRDAVNRLERPPRLVRVSPDVDLVDSALEVFG